VVGNSGSGKSTIARALAARLGVAWVELDATYHQPGWQQLPAGEFRARVAAATAADGWVVDGNYSTVQDLVWARADTVVWVDPPRWTVMRRVAWRTLRRLVLRTRLWNGNRERWRNLLTANPHDSIIAWAWQQHGAYRRRYAAASGDPGLAHLRFVRIRSSADVHRLLDQAGNAAATGNRPGRRKEPPA
jgi:adenylate kinase family enzyme